MKEIALFFDKLEDDIRTVLSHHPITYSMIGGVGVVLFWRGVWITADLVSSYLIPPEHMYWNGPLSIVVSVAILLVTGLFVSFFITDRIILSGLNHERKLAEKTEEEVREERNILTEVARAITSLEQQIQDIKKDLTVR